MTITYEGKMDELAAGIQMLTEEPRFRAGLAALGDAVVSAERREGPIEVSWDGTRATIRYQETVHFYRGLGLLVQEADRKAPLERVETPRFQTIGVMIEASRNAVPSVDSLKNLLRKMALMGLNLCMVYCEDTYEIPERPYFGYLRGRYSRQELQECDDYAAALGIEMIPCIQTLAHLEQALKWNYAAPMRDTNDILLAGEEQTYEFIEQMIRAASAPFRSKRIHIGMDEAHQLGLGRYLDKNGFRRRFDIMNDHLRRVLAITEKYGLQPMIWSDMYFRLGSPTGAYYDLNSSVPEEVVSDMPNNVQFVYWDYYHKDPDFYEEYIRRHRLFGSEPVFAGGCWTWIGLTPAYGKTFQTTNAALTACKKQGLREVFVTMWGDNGNESNLAAVLPGLQLYAEHGYADEVKEEVLRERFAFCVDGNLDAFLNLRFLDEVPGVSDGNQEEANPSKYLLWQDVLIGMFDEHVRGKELGVYYAKLAEKIGEAARQGGEYRRFFELYESLASVLALKSEIGLKIRDSYLAGDRKRLKELAGQLEELQGRVQKQRAIHRDLWYRTYKPFGWEVLDIRYGGLLARLDTARLRLTDYAEGRLERIAELEEERLPFDAYWSWGPGKLGANNAYHRIVTAGAFSV